MCKLCEGYVAEFLNHFVVVVVDSKNELQPKFCVVNEKMKCTLLDDDFVVCHCRCLRILFSLAYFLGRTLNYEKFHLF